MISASSDLRDKIVTVVNTPTGNILSSVSHIDQFAFAQQFLPATCCDCGTEIERGGCGWCVDCDPFAGDPNEPELPRGCGVFKEWHYTEEN